ncbi:MAG: MEKHLA domain-containing protein [Zetaproteobacteria bacterium]|nr:MEKHLA domain-containing protein [Zetaproteobacteria bacterium]
MLTRPSALNQYHAHHIGCLSDSLYRWTGKGLIDKGETAVDAAKRLYYAPFALLSHGIEADPVLNYGNQTGQSLFAIAWESLIQMPSRLTAEAVRQVERDALMARVTQKGCITDYSGIRIAANGRRFRIEQAVVWNVLDGAGRYLGQAAMFAQWHDL